MKAVKVFLWICEDFTKQNRFFLKFFRWTLLGVKGLVKEALYFKGAVRVMAVQFILFYFADYSPSIAMEL